ncbi:hypothetical protein C3B64_13065 [Clostridium botulinum]|uniref:TIR domain-containing protein n=1 Tax=Clostridium botulinum TaxID=1491 RepID=A0AAU8YY66_CLOBO|nr:hypothetical protein C3B64_13065 [Clostridium botulinum]
MLQNNNFIINKLVVIGGSRVKVFVSHSSNDKDKIDELIIVLEILKCEVFYSSKSDTNKIGFGENFYTKIRKEIKESDRILAMVSQNFYESIPSQIEMGIAYAFEKEITPIGIENKNYKELLKGLFTSNDRLASIYSEYDMINILELFSKEPSKVTSSARRIVERANETKGLILKTDEIGPIKSTENYIEELILTGQLNINECIFLKYILHKRRYRFEWAWKIDEGVNKFKKWVDSNLYYLDSEVKEVYEDIIHHFNDLSLFDEIEYTGPGNVRLYGFKPNFSKDLVNLYNKNKMIIENECNKQEILS